MARDSFGSKVARAARTGGGRPGGPRTLNTFHIAFIVIIVIGIALVTYSRSEALNGTVANSTPPTTKQTWYAALDFDVCGTILPNLPANPNLYSKKSPSTSPSLGFYTTGNGLITIHPLNHNQAGNNATLNKFFNNYPGLLLSQTELKLPGKKAFKNGGKCNLKTASVRTEVWPSGVGSTGQLLTNNLSTFVFQNDLEITVAFLPNGVSVPKPPSSLLRTMFNTKPPSSSKSTPTKTTPASPSLPITSHPPIPTPPSSHVSLPSSTHASSPLSSHISIPSSGAKRGP